MFNRTVVIFGTFDELHEGHIQFINQANKKGEKLVAIIARDKNIIELKNKKPKYNEEIRLKKILELKEIDNAFLGDKEKGVYKVLKNINPDLIYLGYDQLDLFDDLKNRIEEKVLPNIKLIFGKSYKPEIFHSSILDK